ncbi:MAG: DUF3352 domain-containing protein [candidate division KSB1 bacterium]|jgi:hypothetical protein|nr:DUF3352 domain-containing protein [candidate division KSB1 bacterium]
MSWKKIILTALVVIILLIAIYVISLILRQQRLSEVIPYDTEFIITIDDPIQFWNDFEDSQLWERFRDSKMASQTRLMFDEIRKNIGSERNRKLMRMLFNRDVSILISEQDGEYHYALLANIGLKSKLIQFANSTKGLILPQSKDIKYEQIEHNGREIELIRLLENRQEIAYTFINNIVIISDRLELVKRCTMTSDKMLISIDDNRAHNRIQSRLDKNDKLRIYVNSPVVFKRLLRSFVAPVNPFVQDLLSGSEFMGISASFKGEGLLLTGLSAMKEDNELMQLLSGSIQQSAIFDKIPPSAWGMITLTFDSFDKIWAFTTDQLKNDRSTWNEFEKSRQDLKNDLGIDIEKDLLSWVGKEFGAMGMPPSYYGDQGKTVLWIAANDKSNALESLDRIKKAIEIRLPLLFKEKKYKEFEISYLDLPLFLKIFFNPIFQRITKPYWTMIDDYVLFSDDINSLKSLIDAYRTKQNITKTADFEELKKQLPEENSLFTYLEMSAALSSIRTYLDRNAVQTLNQWKPYLLKFKSMGLSLNEEKSDIQTMVYLHLKQAEPAKITERWSIATNASVTMAPKAVDIDGVRGEEIIFADKSGMMQIVTSEARPVDGWPRYFEEPVDNTPAIGDIDGDNEHDIVVTSAGKVYALDKSGSNINEHWPVDLEETIFASPVIADVDDRDDPDIIIATNNRMVHVFDAEGDSLPGWPQSTDGPIRAAPAVGDIDGDGKMEIVTATMNGNIYVWEHDGSLKDNWPQQTNGMITAPPVLGNIEGDKKLEIVVCTWDGRVHVLNTGGHSLSGWPAETGAIISSAATLADIDGDGNMEILAGTENRWLHIWNAAGVSRSGWPVRTMGKIKNQPLVADIDGDREMDVIAASDDGKVYAWDGNGKLLSGWPLRGSATPLLGDFDGDGRIDLVTGSWDKNVYYWSLTGDYDPDMVEWGQFQGDKGNTGVYGMK